MISVSKNQDLCINFYVFEGVKSIGGTQFIIKIDQGQVVWENLSHASSSSCRPIMLLMGKETRENCGIVSQLQEERKDCQFTVEHFNNPVNAKINATMSMVDGKMHSLLTGLGGAFCCLCTSSDD